MSEKLSPRNTISRKRVGLAFTGVLGLALAGCSGPSTPEAGNVAPAVSLDSSPSSTANSVLDTPVTSTISTIPPSTEANYTVTFDTLGSTDTDIVALYRVPGGRQANGDQNGTFRDGQTTRAFCQTVSRLVTSDPGLNEIPRSSDVWVRVEGAPGQVHYTSGTFLEQPLPPLPQC